MGKLSFLRRINWRDVLSRLPLPMLALAASYGVYSYATLFVPWPVALIQAAAFEATYIGLAAAKGLNGEERRRSKWISIGAVAVSIIYNSLAGFFHRQPGMLKELWWLFEALLAVLHGAPLAWVAYLVADVLLHSEGKSEPAPALLAPAQPTIDIEAITRQIKEAVSRELAEALGGLPDLVRKEIAGALYSPAGDGGSDMGNAGDKKADQPISLNGLIDLPELTPTPIRGGESRGVRVRKMRETMTWDEIADQERVSKRTVQNWMKEE